MSTDVFGLMSTPWSFVQLYILHHAEIALVPPAADSVSCKLHGMALPADRIPSQQNFSRSALVAHRCRIAEPSVSLL